jgi:SM-20-related protein
MLSQYLSLNLQQQLSEISEHGFSIMDNFISPANILALADEINTLNANSHMQIANTGRSPISINTQLRGDSIYWLNEVEASPAQQAYFKKMEDLRCGLNQHLYLGLFSLESHLALYPIGAGYQKHLDCFQFKDGEQLPKRQISCILYLNQDWLAEDGGYLRLHLNAYERARLNLKESYLDIAPISGRLVLFLSDTFYHEVLATTRIRKSLTSWFLTR